MACLGQTVDDWTLSSHTFPPMLDQLVHVPNNENYQIRVVLSSGEDINTTKDNFYHDCAGIKNTSTDICGVWTRP